MATIFSREEKAEALFGEILKNPEACRRLMDTFNDSLDMADVLDAPTVKCTAVCRSAVQCLREQGSVGLSDGDLPAQYV